MTTERARYWLAAFVAALLALYATLFARQTYNLIDLPTWIDVSEWPATALYLGAAGLALRRQARWSALCLVAGMLAFFGAQSGWMFQVPLGFMMVTVGTLACLFILPPRWERR